MPENKTLHILSNSELFNGLTIDDLKKLYSYCQKVEFKETDTLIKEGQIVSELYIITKGQAEVLLPKQSKRLETVKLATKKVGGFFGEYSLIDSKPSSASIIATQPGELVKIANIDLDIIFKKNDRIAKIIYLNIVRVLIRRLRNINKEYDMVYLV
ncbi:hypothetical protein LCGC14_1679810 [marine sediment metagenome]|uniref:Cyclic nucleotide-binding domain-containing protein n=1 Tax=marine sediment metagenome TaxID=412755 RepID=A0A0F9KP25_9ZZZZ|nr:cyclic nucleotide-binding domain-containing protein [Candidatus Scalindua sediminis]